MTLFKNLVLGTLMVAPALAASLPVEVKAAITQQIVPIDIKDPVIVELMTLIKSPLKLEAAGLQTPPGISLIGNAVDTANAQAGKKGTEVRQRWQYKLKIGPNVSRLNGKYQARFRVVGGQGDTPAKPTHVVDFSLQSENFRKSTSVNGGTEPH